MYEITYKDKKINMLNHHDVKKLLHLTKDECLVIPERVDGHPVNGLDYGCFNGITGIKEIVFPKSLIYVAADAISFCSFERLIFGENIDCLETRGLRTNKNLKSIEIDEGCLNYKTIQGNLYYKEENSLLFGLNNELSEDTSKIEIQAFSYSQIQSIVIPESVTEIGVEAFACCKDLESVEFKGKSLLRIDKNAFFNCKKLKKVEIPRSVSRIGSYSFKGTGLKELTFEDRRKTELPLEIGYESFMGTNLKVVDLSNINNLIIEYSAFRNAKVKSLSLNGIIKLFKNAFMRCNIERISLKDIDVIDYEDALGINNEGLSEIIKKHNRLKTETSFSLENNQWIEDRFW